MNPFAFPWLDLAIAVPLLGAAVVAVLRDARSASNWCIAFAGVSLACASMAATGHFAGYAAGTLRGIEPAFRIDDLSAPLIPLIALLHLSVALATARTQAGRFSFARLLLFASLRSAVFACAGSWPLIAFLALETMLTPLGNRRPFRLRDLGFLHSVLASALLVLGFAVGARWSELGAMLILLAALVRTGGLPAQVWVTDLFENGSFGSALLSVVPLVGVYAAVRLALPTAPEWALEIFGIAALVTALYAAGMGVVERDSRRFFAYLCVSHGALVMVGVGLHTPFAVTSALVMWLSSALSLMGVGLILRALEARVGTLALTEYRGLFDKAPLLAIGFLLTGLATVGFPGTSGFVAVEILVDEGVGSHEAVGLAVVLIAAINGIGVVRAYLLLFTGRRNTPGVALGITAREKIVVLALAALILCGGLIPQAYLESRHRAAEGILRDRPEAERPSH